MRSQFGKITVLMLIVVAYFALHFFAQNVLPSPVGFDQQAKVIELVLMALGLSSIVFLAEQIRLTEKRARHAAYHNFFDSLPKKTNYDDFGNVLSTYGLEKSFTLSMPLSLEQSKKIYDNDVHSRAVRAYLDDFEEFAGAVRSGVVDGAYAFSLEGSRSIRAFRVLEQLIKLYRADMSLPTCYIQLEKLVKRWEKKKSKQAEKIQNHY